MSAGLPGTGLSVREYEKSTEAHAVGPVGTVIMVLLLVGAAVLIVAGLLALIH
jgi:hypothetical protein